jgi:glutamate-1-semialdehyde 2,1-aminomutase
VSIPYCDPVACPAAGCAPEVCTGAGIRSNAAFYERSCAAIPGGVNSSIRAFRSVGGTPYVVARADGPRVWDVEGNELLDLVQSYGAIILGHAHPAVVAAVSAAAADGTSFGAPTPREMKLAEAVRERVPSCERVRLMNSGTEATSTAIRLARGVTGRDRVVTFAGNFHGATDALLAAGGSGVATLGIPGTAGVPAAAVSETMVVPFNVVPELDQDVACVIVEPVAANMGVVAPLPGFLEGLRAACDRVGALLVFDEVITGFRLSRGGFQGLHPVRPDLTCFGKVIGGGLPIGAVGGRAEVMEELTPLGVVFHAGTLSGNPLATAAGLAALALLDDEAYERLERTATRLQSGLQQAVDAAGLPVTVPRVNSLVGLHCSTTPPVDYETARTTDTDLYAQLFHALLRRGVALAPGAYEALFPGLAHDDATIDQIVNQAADAAAEVAATR